MPAAQPAAASASAHQRGRKEYPDFMRYVVIGVLILIVLSLGSALFYVFQDRSDSNRALKALALRVGLSVGLFLFLMIAYYFGLVPGRL